MYNIKLTAVFPEISHDVIVTVLPELMYKPPPLKKIKESYKEQNNQVQLKLKLTSI